ncbi:branched-chain amino acid ABC transporter permease/ATP-binding protein [Pseudonocardia xishanensis]|uniref:branched-chain amino acid ABC transporter permease/ATP-binding protein n=1 Tax=Pseudonocardia xishanensis TaxID=630995 RepID=UPI0031EBC512
MTFLLLGVGAGALYVLVAAGLILIHRGSGLINFAHVAIGLCGAYTYWELRELRGVPTWLAVLAGIAVSAGLGAGVHLLVMRPLRNASPLTRLIATLAVMAGLQAAMQLRYADSIYVRVEPMLPTGAVSVLGVTVPGDRLLVFGITVLLIALLWAVYRWTALGRITAAVSENLRAAAALGLSPDVIASLNWALGSAMAALATILIAPISGLTPALATSLIIPALATAVVARFASFPIALATGTLLGIIQSEVTYFVPVPGLDAAIPFVVVAVVLLARSKPIAARGEPVFRFASVGTGGVRARYVLPVTLVALLLIWGVVPIDWVSAVGVQLPVALIVLSVVVVTGYTGQLSLAQFAFAGIGAFVAARLTVLGAPFGVALVLACASTIPLSIVVGLAGARARGVNLAIVTLGLAVTVEAMIFNNPVLTGGFDGLQVGTPTLFGIALGAIATPAVYASFTLLVFVGCAVVVGNLRRGRAGRRLLAVRSNERAAAALGISGLGAKVYAFSLGGVLAACGGVLLTFANPIVTFGDAFTPLRSIQMVQEAVVGGVGWLVGPLLGSTLDPGTVGSKIMEAVAGSPNPAWLTLVGAVILVVALLQAPDGLVPLNTHLLRAGWDRVTRLFGRSPSDRPLAARGVLGGDEGPSRVAPHTLHVTDLKVRFGGTIALDGPSLTVGPGEVVGLIGANGAGKTTLLDGVTGFVPLDRGSVLLDGLELHTLGPARRARAGLGRSFQSLELFDDLTVRENLLSASERRDPWAYLTTLLRPGVPALNAMTRAAVQEFDLGPDLDRRPGELSYARRRLVAIARTVAARPSVLLLDEPAAGIDAAEAHELGELIRRLADVWGMGVLLVEHDVELVMRVCDRILVLENGREIATGTPEQIRMDARVIESYLGGSTSPVEV